MQSSDRREFLRGWGGAKDLAPVKAEPTPSDSGASAEENSAAHRFLPLLHISRPAMATLFEAFVPSEHRGLGIDVAIEALECLETLEEAMSVYRASSELSKINARADKEWTAVEPSLFALIQRAIFLSIMTEGAFDITARPLTRLWQQARRLGREPTQEELLAARERVGTDHIELDEHNHRIRFNRPGVELDLGAIGKGYALDVIASAMQESGAIQCALHGGQSSVLAWGGRPDRRGELQPWSFGVGHPLRPEKRLAEIRVLEGALGTSGSARQFFYVDGRRLCHVIDPRTGLPVEGVLAVTVLAKSAAIADALSTAFFVLGPESAERVFAAAKAEQASKSCASAAPAVQRALEFEDYMKDCAALFVLQGKNPHQVELSTINMERVDWVAL